jgi:predicted Fe-Mo cluster-binding NifX family protein
MKIAVTSKGRELESQVDPRFGRAAYILVVDSETFKFEVIDNQVNADAFKGAGIQAATQVHDKGGQVLLTGFCGPNAFKVLQAAQIEVANDASGTVREAVDAYLNGQLSVATAANVEGHW